MKKIILPSALLFLLVAANFPAGTLIPKEDLPKFYESWFQDPYSYMFSSPDEITIGDKSFGRFDAGINGIMKYGGLYDCIVQYNSAHGISRKDEEGPFSDRWTEDIRAFAGMKVVLKEQNGFSWFNPEIVKWGSENLVPDPNQRIGNVKFSQIYTFVFSRFFRLMAASHQWLAEKNAWEKESKKYMDAVARDEWGGVDYLEERFRGELSDLEGPHDFMNQTVGMSMGFWLRRHMDGTEDELWIALQEMMMKYDPEFLQSLN